MSSVFPLPQRVRSILKNQRQGYSISLIGGWDETHQVKNVRFENFKVNGQKLLDGRDILLYTRHADGITFA